MARNLKCPGKSVGAFNFSSENIMPKFLKNIQKKCKLLQLMLDDRSHAEMHKFTTREKNITDKPKKCCEVTCYEKAL